MREEFEDADVEELRSLKRIGSRENPDGPKVKSTKSIQKDQWGSDIEFLLSCITLSVGLGNVWRYLRSFTCTARYHLSFIQISIHSS